MALSSEKFNDMILGLRIGLQPSQPLAVAVSGGADSTALCFLLNRWAGEHGGHKIYALHVHHGLRVHSEGEAEIIRETLSSLGHVEFVSLKWEGDKPAAALQEKARRARYGLLADYCGAHDIAYLFLGHHLGDQAETVLFRLAKGSGIDGLAGMNDVHDYSENLRILRPLLDVSKCELIDVCEGAGVGYIDDPSNENRDFARVRLRKSYDVLAAEGLTHKRLGVMAKRARRARVALDYYSGEVYEQSILFKDTKRIEFIFSVLLEAPEEVFIRCLLKGFKHFDFGKDYAPRMERVEQITYDLLCDKPFRKRTLGGVVFMRDDKRQVFTMLREQ